MRDIDFILEEQKAKSEDDSVSAKDKVKAAKRTDKDARDFFAQNGSDLEKDF